MFASETSYSAVNIPTHDLCSLPSQHVQHSALALKSLTSLEQTPQRNWLDFSETKLSFTGPGLCSTQPKSRRISLWNLVYGHTGLHGGLTLTNLI